MWEDSVILKHSHSLDNNNNVMCGLSGSNIIVSLIKCAESQSQWQWQFSGQCSTHSRITLFSAHQSGGGQPILTGLLWGLKMTSSRTSGQPLIREILRKFADEGTPFPFVSVIRLFCPSATTCKDTTILDQRISASGMASDTAAASTGHGKGNLGNILAVIPAFPILLRPSFVVRVCPFPGLLLCRANPKSQHPHIMGGHWTNGPTSTTAIEQARIGLTTFAQHNS